MANKRGGGGGGVRLAKKGVRIMAPYIKYSPIRGNLEL